MKRVTQKSVRAFQIEIKAAWQKQVASIISTGKKLSEAKKALGHGHWGQLFDGPDAPPFGVDVAEALMRIARHPTLSKPEHVPNLPVAWSTLEVLARAESKDLEAWLRDGSLNSATTRHEAESLVSPPPPPPPDVIQDPEGGMPHEIEFKELPLYGGASAERTQTLKALEGIGFNMADVANEMADIAAGAEETQTPAPTIDETQILRHQIDLCLIQLEAARTLSFLPDAEFERWALRAAARLHRLLDKKR